MFSISNSIFSSSKVRTFIISVSVVTISGGGLVQPACADVFSQLASADDEFFNSSERTLNGDGRSSEDLTTGTSADVLRGRVQENQKQDQQKDRGLSRQDIKPINGSQDDPFHKNSTKPGETILDIPDSAFDELKLDGAPEPPAPRLDGGINQGNNLPPDFVGTPGNGLPDNVPQQDFGPNTANQKQLLPPQKVDSNDPDAANQQLLIAWEQWHYRVAAKIFQKFDGIASRMFSRALQAEVAYDVTADGHIVNVKVLRKSPDMMYNMTLYTVVKSLQGDPILAFPKGSRRMVVAKRGVFYFGSMKESGFKYHKNDVELQTPRDPFKQGG
jgi:hypothetical protein